MKIFVSNDISEKGVALLREHFDVDVFLLFVQKKR